MESPAQNYEVLTPQRNKGKQFVDMFQQLPLSEFILIAMWKTSVLNL